MITVMGLVALVLWVPLAFLWLIVFSEGRIDQATAEFTRSWSR